MKRSLSNPLPVLFLFCALIVAGCDSVSSEDEASAFSLDGSWTAASSGLFRVGYILSEWASVDSV